MKNLHEKKERKFSTGTISNQGGQDALFSDEDEENDFYIIQE